MGHGRRRPLSTQRHSAGSRLSRKPTTITTHRVPRPRSTRGRWIRLPAEEPSAPAKAHPPHEGKPFSSGFGSASASRLAPGDRVACLASGALLPAHELAAGVNLGPTVHFAAMGTKGTFRRRLGNQSVAVPVLLSRIRICGAAPKGIFVTNERSSHSDLASCGDKRRAFEPSDSSRPKRSSEPPPQLDARADERAFESPRTPPHHALCRTALAFGRSQQKPAFAPRACFKP